MESSRSGVGQFDRQGAGRTDFDGRLYALFIALIRVDPWGSFQIMDGGKPGDAFSCADTDFVIVSNCNQLSLGFSHINLLLAAGRFIVRSIIH